MNNRNLIAYHGQPELKAKTLQIVESHRLADTLQQGMTGQDGKGCAVWCTVGAYSHADYETKLGIPVEIAVLEDRIFENLSVEQAKLWPGQFLEAIQPGADLTMVFPQLYYWVWTDPEKGILRHVTDEKVKQEFLDCLELYARWGRGDTPSETEWSEAIEKLNALARALALALALDLARALARALALARARALALARALSWEEIYAATAAKTLELLRAAPIAEAPLPITR